MIYLLKQAKANNHIIRADGDIWVDVDGTIRVNKAAGGQVIAGKYSELGRADAVVRDIFDVAKLTEGDTFYIMPDK